jgi:N-acyl-D-aspartate/D-glutamate deacylase
MLSCERLASKISSYADYLDVINPDPLGMDVITDAIHWVQVRTDLPR